MEVALSDIRSPKRCGLFKPGHEPHWIQISRASEDVDNPPVPGRLVEFRPDGTALIECEQGVHACWNHDLDRMAEAITATEGQLFLQQRWGLLWVPGQDGRFAFCVVTPGKQVPCPSEAPTGTAAELLERAGGFTLRIEDVRRSLKRRS